MRSTLLLPLLVVLCGAGCRHDMWRERFAQSPSPTAAGTPAAGIAAASISAASAAAVKDATVQGTAVRESEPRGATANPSNNSSTAGIVVPASAMTVTSPNGDTIPGNAESPPDPPPPDDSPAVRLAQPNQTQFLTLDDAFTYALMGHPIIKTDAQFQRTDVALLSNPESVGAMLDAELARTGFLFGQRGEQAARADYDPQLTSQMVWGRDENLQNNGLAAGGVFPGRALIEETAVHSTALRQNLLRGGQVSLVQNWNFNNTNRLDVLFNSFYTGTARMEYRQPMLAGAGLDYSLTAGPPGQAINGVTGVSQGILIAKANTRIAELQLESRVSDLLRDVSANYWQLTHSLRSLETLDEALRRLDELGKNVAARAAAQTDISRMDELNLRESVAQLLQQRLTVTRQIQESQLRLVRLFGIDPRGGIATLIPTSQQPVAPLVVDMPSAVVLARMQRPELKRQRLRIQTAQRQYVAAQNLLWPRLDFVSSYNVNGFGNHFHTDAPPSPTQDIESAVDNLLQGDQTGWQLGFEYVQPLGRRLEKTRVRNLRAQLQKEQIVLAEQEKELELHLQSLVQELEYAWMALENSSFRTSLAKEKIAASRQLYETEATAAHLLQWIDAEVAFATAVTTMETAANDYRRAETDFFHARGDLIANSGFRVHGSDPLICCLWDRSCYWPKSVRKP